MTGTKAVAAAMVLVGYAGVVGCGEKASARGEPPRANAVAVNGAPARPLPKLVDLGAGKCIPCKAMAPILEQLRADYAGRLEVQFIDVWQNPDAGGEYGVNIIPTQIFYGADGKELARHEGFMGREEILAQWKAFGVSL